MTIYVHYDNIYLLLQRHYIEMKVIIKAKNEEIAYQSISFSGGERHVQLLANEAEDVREVDLQANISSSDDILDLLLLVNALRNQFGSELKVNLELPYLPYARQDRVCAPGQAFSLEVFAQLVRTIRPANIVTWDCHSDVGLRLVDAVNVAPADIILSDVELTKLLQQESTVLVCPDKGAIPRCTNIQRALGLEQLVYCEKKRDPLTGRIVNTEVMIDDLSGKCAVVTDDICDGGFTFIKIAQQLREKNVAKVFLFVTHGIFSKGIEVFDGLVDEVITTNSRQQTNHPKLRVIEYEHNINQASDNGR